MIFNFPSSPQPVPRPFTNGFAGVYRGVLVNSNHNQIKKINSSKTQETFSVGSICFELSE
jgi:hypothetical protein